MLNKIKEMLSNDQKVRLECLDRNKYIHKNTEYPSAREKVLDSNLIVTSVAIDDIALFLSDTPYCIPVNDLSYFKIAEDKTAFDDLIDVAVKAYKDGFADEIILNDFISISTQDETYGVSKTDTNSFEVKETIKNINSLYTETFVIEDNHNLMKALEGASGTLANGEEFLVSNDAYSYTNKNKLLILIGGEKMHANLSILKGATVTQKRGK